MNTIQDKENLQNPDLIPEEVSEIQKRFDRKKAKKVEKLRQWNIRAEAKRNKQQMRRKVKIQAYKDKREYSRQINQNREHKWFSFFTKWFFIGLILIIISLTITLAFQPQTWLEKIITVLSGVLSTVGIALLVGAIFDFSKNSEAFIRFISNILSDIIMSKTFLTTLSDKDKEKALMLILTPSNKQLEQYSNINAFFKKRIGEITNMFDINFKTNVILDINAYRDDKDGRIWCKTVLTQTIYKIQDNFKPVEVIFEKDGSISDDFYILPPIGESISIEGKKTPLSQGGIECIKIIYEIPKELERYDHLTIKRTMLEPGRDHWINYYWQSLTPYEGVTCTIDCEKDLTIKDYMIFDNKAYYHVALSNDRTRLSITSSQWLDMDTGFVVTISDTDNSTIINS